jgi:hypothetical protein
MSKTSNSNKQPSGTPKNIPGNIKEQLKNHVPRMRKPPPPPPPKKKD